jgi:VCBS repeat-containing protein
MIEDLNVVSGNVTATGTLNFSDADLSDTHTVSGWTLTSAETPDGPIEEQAILDMLQNAFSAGVTGESNGSGQVQWSIAVPNAELQGIPVGGTAKIVYTLTLDDGHGGETQQDVTITVLGVNDAPIIFTESQQVTQDGASATLAGVYIADPDAGSDALTITAHAGQGTLAAVSANGLTIDGSNDGSNGTLSASGSLDAINAALADGITYTPTLVGGVPPTTDMVSVRVDDGHGGTDVTNFIFNVAGENNVTLTGTGAKDVIYGTGWNDTLTGNGAADRFVFEPETGGGIGEDVITDFQAGTDFLSFNNIFSNVDALLAATTDVGGHAVITVDSNNTVTLTNVTKQQLEDTQANIHVFHV